MKSEYFAFARYVTYGFIAGLFITWGISEMKPTKQSPSTLNQQRKMHCVIDLTNTMTREFVREHPDVFKDLADKTCFD